MFKVRPRCLDRRGLLLLSLLLCVTACATVASRPAPPTVDQIIAMSRAGVPPDEIVRQMRETNGVYELSASQLAVLKEQGVHDAVIDYMQRTYLAEARREQASADWLNAGPYPYNVYSPWW